MERAGFKSKLKLEFQIEVSGIPHDWSEDTIRQLFKLFGNVTNVSDFQPDPCYQREQMMFCSVYFDSLEAAVNASRFTSRFGMI